MMVFSLTHTRARTQIYSPWCTLTLVRCEDGFFLFLFLLLLHPLTAAAAGHHPSSSSFASQPEHSGRGTADGRPRTKAFPSSTPWKSGPENPHAIDPIFLARTSSCFSAGCSFLCSHFSHCRDRGKSVARTHTHVHTLARTHTLFSSNFVPLAKKIQLFFPTRGKTHFSTPAHPAGRGQSLGALPARAAMSIESATGKNKNRNRISSDRTTDDDDDVRVGSALLSAAG